MLYGMETKPAVESKSTSSRRLASRSYSCNNKTVAFMNVITYLFYFVRSAVVLSKPDSCGALPPDNNIRNSWKFPFEGLSCFR
jgi:hypothetical protein